MSKQQPSWLKEAVFYQIYPQSFYDSNGDGMGDIAGIMQKLDYIKSIGCNAVWLGPVFVSPFHDGGYDVADYRRVDPRYGTNDDLVRLFAAAHERGMRIVLDLVAGHTSVEHPWFRQSMRAERNEYTDRYLWIEPVWREKPAHLATVSGYAERNGAYVANFFWCQPALNYGYADPDPANPWEKPLDHPACQATLRELRGTMEFWLQLGADGFRVDMAQSLVRGHDEARRISALQTLWRGIRRWLDRDYPEALLMAEWSYPKHAIAAGFHVDFMIHFETVAYNSLFRNHRPELISALPRGNTYFDRNANGDIRLFADIFLEHYNATRGQGYISVPTGNHDVPPRLAEDRSPDELKCALLFLLMLPGIPFIYYGDEIGMRYIHGLASKEGGYERTGVRTPMQWDATKNAGFSTADPARLYLPVEAAPEDRTVEAAWRDPGSVLHFVRHLITLRKEHGALGADGDFRLIYAEKGGYPFVFERAAGGERFWIAVNPSGTARSADWKNDAASARPLVRGRAALTLDNGTARVELPGGGFGLWKIEEK
jgi:maltose alpha-D-glucosyltransferase/alpha-amylase